MTKNKTTTKSPATVRPLRVFSDGSGAPALVTFQGYTFSCDFLGERKMNLVGGPRTMSMIEHKIAVDVCRKGYDEYLETAVDAAWRALNAAMYADVVGVAS